MKNISYKKLIHYIIAFVAIWCIDLISIRIIWNAGFIRKCMSKALIVFPIQAFSLKRLFDFCTAWIILLCIISNGVYFYFFLMPSKVFRILQIAHNKQKDVTYESNTNDQKDEDILSVKELIKSFLTFIVTIFISVDFCIAITQTPLVLTLLDISQDSWIAISVLGMCICCFVAYVSLTVIPYIVKNYFFIF